MLPPETVRTDAGSTGTTRSLWLRLPAVVRAVVAGLVILAVGQLPPGVFLILALKITPAIPWFLPATVVWLLLFWSYLGGRGWPATTARSRAENLRSTPLRANIWLWALLAGGLGMVSVLCAALLTGRVATLPAEAYAAPFDLSSFPPWTVVAFFMNVALVAGVVEEAAFRGYMLSILQRRYGWLIGITIVAIVFYVTHLSHAYATIAFVPFFMAYSLLHGMLVYCTHSIRPSVILHALGDFSILPIQYGVVGNPLGTSVNVHVLAVACFGVASLLAFRRLFRLTLRPD